MNQAPFVCINQPCRAEWQLSDVDIHNEGQGLLFRCPMCGARNKVTRVDDVDGEARYVQGEAPSGAKITLKDPAEDGDVSDVQDAPRAANAGPSIRPSSRPAGKRSKKGR